MPEREPCSCCVNTFSTAAADGDLDRYRRQGPDGTTKALIDAIVAEGIEGATLLDIGGGIGVIPLELLRAGAASSVAVDASEAYVTASRAEATRRGFGDRMEARFGDFVALAPNVSKADIVTLDRVVCCDPNLAGLLGAAAEKAQRMVGLVYPRVTWWNKVAQRGIAAWGWLTRDATRWHLHPEARIDGMLRRAGFEKREVDRTLIWQVALYVRPAA